MSTPIMMSEERQEKWRGKLAVMPARTNWVGEDLLGVYCSDKSDPDLNESQQQQGEGIRQKEVAVWTSSTDSRPNED